MLVVIRSEAYGPSAAGVYHGALHWSRSLTCQALLCQAAPDRNCGIRVPSAAALYEGRWQLLGDLTHSRRLALRNSITVLDPRSS